MTKSNERSFALRAIITFKALKALFLFAIAGAALTLRAELVTDMQKAFTWLGLDAGRPTLRKLLHIRPDQVIWIGIGSALYASIFSVEAWGLHLRKRWAEWLTVIATASLIPFEIYELVEDATITEVAALVVNIAIVVYLVVRIFRKR